MALMSRHGFSSNTEVEASSFSVWNCVITFLQILLVSTILYGAGWNQGQLYNMTPENLVRFQHFRAIAFFFCVWALQSVALALLLVWAIGKRSYHLCHSWMLCEALMQVFIVLSSIYFAYRSFLENQHYDTPSLRALPNSNDDFSVSSSTTVVSTGNTFHHSHESFRPPKHFAFLIILHFLIKGFGFWIVWRYMRLLKTTNIQVISNNEAGPSGNSADGTLSNCGARQVSPPPSYAYLCKDDLPCYDDALKLCLKDSSPDSDIDNNSSSNNCNETQTESKNTFVPVPLS